MSYPSRIQKCRACGNTDLVPCVSLGDQYLSSVFPADLNYREQAPRWPLDLVLCRKGAKGNACGLVQLAHEIDLDAMYDAYPYTSSSNSSMNLILKDVAESGRALGHLLPDDLILDIGGNDGTLLAFFKEDPYTLLNIDPAKNVTSLFESPRYTRVGGFFGESLFRSSAKRNAKLIFSIAMFYHLHDPVQFSREVAACLDDDGVWIIQMAYLPAMIRTNMHDNIVHEHAGYYAAHHMKWVMEQVGLEVFDVAPNDVYGGSFRIFVKKQGNPHFSSAERYQRLLEEELREGLFDQQTYAAFEERLKKMRDDLRALCLRIRDEGKIIWAYGASTKGNTILQYCGIGGDMITAAADSNPFKIGKYMIGSDIPIRSETEMRAAKPDYLLALPYSFVDGFRAREAALVSSGTKFIVPLPDVRIV